MCNWATKPLNVTMWMVRKGEKERTRGRDGERERWTICRKLWFVCKCRFTHFDSGCDIYVCDLIRWFVEIDFQTDGICTMDLWKLMNSQWNRRGWLFDVDIHKWFLSAKNSAHQTIDKSEQIGELAYDMNTDCISDCDIHNGQIYNIYIYFVSMRRESGIHLKNGLHRLQKSNQWEHTIKKKTPHESKNSTRKTR